MDAEDAAVKDFIEILEEHRRSCERQGKYAEADVAKSRLEELKQHEENRKRETLRSNQIAERLAVEEAHMIEFQQFNLAWDQKMTDFEQNASQLLEAMRNRHENELRDLQTSIVSKQTKPKFSRDLLNLRKIQETLAKQRDYQEARKMQVKADALEAWEMERWQGARQAEASLREENWRALKKNELRALETRLQAARAGSKKQRQLELERLLQRYLNIKAELELQQQADRARLERALSLGPLAPPPPSSLPSHTGGGAGGAPAGELALISTSQGGRRQRSNPNKRGKGGPRSRLLAPMSV